MKHISREEKNRRARECYWSMTPEQKEAKLSKRKEWIRNNKDKIRSYNQSRVMTPEKLVKKKDVQVRYRNSDKGKESARRFAKEWIKENTHKQNAHKKVAYALRKGLLVKMPCEVCETLPSVAHHDDYSKPLDVRWLCPKHHTDIHCEPRRKEMREQKALSKD